MFRDQNRLRDQIVFMEVADGHHIDMNARRYLAAARAAREIVERELGTVHMREFQMPRLPALQATAENIFFESHGCLPDLDGSGHAARARAQADRLLARLTDAPRTRR